MHCQPTAHVNCVSVGSGSSVDLRHHTHPSHHASMDTSTAPEPKITLPLMLRYVEDHEEAADRYLRAALRFFMFDLPPPTKRSSWSASSPPIPQTTSGTSRERRWGLSASQVLEGRCVVGKWCRPLRRRSFTVSVNLLFILLTFRLLSTRVGCLLAIGFLGTKHPFVLLQYWCVSSHFLPL